MRITLAFIRAAFHNTYIYRLDFWLRLVSAGIMMYAMYSLWSILYAQNPDAFGMTRDQMVTYGMLGVIIHPIMDAASFVQYYIGEQVRQGTLELDLMKPLNFIFHMFSRHFGMFFVLVILQSLPAFLIAIIFLGLRFPATPQQALVFVLSLFLGYLIFFAISLIIGLLSIVTLRIDSYEWAYESLVFFASGQFIPLWMFPSSLAAIIAVLPFKNVYFVPMSIYIGAVEGNLYNLLLSQAAWVMGLFLLVQIFWMWVQRRLTVQGG